jgi:signal transduction histidine kinase
MRWSRILAWSAFGVSVAGVAGTLWIGRADTSVADVAATIEIVAFPLVGAIIVSRRPRNPVGWIFCSVGVSFGVGVLAQAWSDYAVVDHPGALPFGPFMTWVGQWIWTPITVLLFVFLPLLFPDGTLPSRRWRPVLWVGAASLVLAIVPVAITAWPIRGPLLAQVSEDAPAAAPDAFKVAFGIQVASILVTFVLGLVSGVSLVFRYRAARGEERSQLKWFAYAVVLLVLAVIASSPLLHLSEWIQAVALTFVPIACAIAIFRYRLYDIDLVIRKTLVFGVLAVFITAVYMALVVGPILLVGAGGDRASVVLGAIATALVAVAFQPVRQRTQRLANRLVYGRRATPYEVLSEFSERMGDAVATEDALPRMARVLCEGTGATGAEVWLRSELEWRRAASWPENGELASPVLSASGDELPPFDAAAHAVAVRHHGELLGALVVTKPPSDPVTPAEQQLIAGLAAQAGLVLLNVSLIADLRASRQRLVAAQDEARRRIERNLHDGAQQQLVALAIKERLATDLIERDPDNARRLMDDIRADTADALETLRDLARGIYPPLLADRGLAAALEAQARKAPMPVAVEVDASRRYAREAEAAAYFCCLEALQNVAKYAGATSATVRLALGEGSIVFEVVDDGVGFDPATARGSGLQGMSDRLDALGGQLRVTSAPGRGASVSGRIPSTSIEPR